MFAVTLLALIQIVIKEGMGVIGVIAGFLLVLAIILIVEAFRAWGGEVLPDVEGSDDGVDLEGSRVVL